MTARRFKAGAVLAFVAAGCGGARRAPDARGDLRLPERPVSAKSGVVNGARCDGASDGYECGADKASVMKCDGGRWTLVGECLGPKGCTSAQKISCDDSIADVNEPCATEGSAACSRDGSRLLECSGGAMIQRASCRGELHCQVRGGTPTCDTRIAQAGDPCGGDGEVACAVDGRSLLRCTNHVMVETRTCPDSCAVKGTEILCR